ncbi:MAG TPA: hypothetical protein VIH86_10660 [Puia sp.]
MTLLIVDTNGNPTTYYAQTAAQAKTLIDTALTQAQPPARIELRN